MRTKRTAVGSRVARVILGAMLGLALASAGAQAALRLEKDAEGRIRPFKVVNAPLPELILEYSRVTGTTITAEGPFDETVKGSVTLFLRRPLAPEAMTELFHRVLYENGYAVVDAPAGNGWIIERSRDARDAPLPVYDAAELPDTARTVSAIYQLRYTNSEHVARTMRSFMPPNSRIIPTTRSQVFVTDTGSNIRKLSEIISRMDTEEAGKRAQNDVWPSANPTRACGEQRIEKLVVEKLEIQDGSNAPGSPKWAIPTPPASPQQGGARK